jgi:hypothetical protein
MYKSILKLVALFLFFFFSTVHAQSTAPTQNVCFGESKTYKVDEADGPSGTVGSSYVWRVLEAGFVGHIANPETNSISVDWGVTPAGVYRLGVTETNAFCEGSENIVTVTIKDPPIVMVNDAVICSGLSTVIKATVNPPDSGNDYIYHWTIPLGVDPGSVATVLASVAGDYTAIVEDVFGCVNTVAKGTLTIKSLPTAMITPVGLTTLCAGGSVILNGNTGTGLSYQWKKTDVDVSGAISNSYTATQSSDYTVTVTDGDGCYKTSLPVNVTVNPLPIAVITAPGSLEFCTGGNVTLASNTGPDLLYLWKNSSNIVVGISASYTATQSSDYTVTITNGNGCSKTSLAVTVIVRTLPDASITPAGTITFCDGYNVRLNAISGSGLSYQWNDTVGVIVGAISSSYTAVQSSVYTVTITDGNFTTNCSATTSPPITVTKITLPVTGAISHD